MAPRIRPCKQLHTRQVQAEGIGPKPGEGTDPQAGV